MGKHLSFLIQLVKRWYTHQVVSPKTNRMNSAADSGRQADDVLALKTGCTSVLLDDCLKYDDAKYLAFPRPHLYVVSAYQTLMLLNTVITTMGQFFG